MTWKSKKREREEKKTPTDWRPSALELVLKVFQQSGSENRREIYIFMSLGFDGMTTGSCCCCSLEEKRREREGNRQR